jgi:hypothetical protein
MRHAIALSTLRGCAQRIGHQTCESLGLVGVGISSVASEAGEAPVRRGVGGFLQFQGRGIVQGKSAWHFGRLCETVTAVSEHMNLELEKLWT